MRKTQNIAVITANTLASIGIYVLIEEYGPPSTIHIFPTFEAFAKSPVSFDYFFIDPDPFISNTGFFLQRRTKTVILCGEKQTTSTLCNLLNTSLPQETIIEQLQRIFSAETEIDKENKELSARETDVLQLVAKGYTNKDIAEQLHISFNTVLTHRKNITAKLGIKTTSGLTFYAMMNGLC